MKHRTSIIIITYNHLDYTKACIESIRKFTKRGTYEIIIVDNLSTDGTREWLKKQKGIKVLLNDENLGFPKGCNQGIRLAQKENDILLLNNDTVVTSRWLENLKICLYSEPKIGAVGSVCNHDENLQGCDFTYESFEQMQELAKKNNQSDSARWEEKAFLIGFCLLIKREVLAQIQTLDEAYSPGYVEDNDLSLRIIQKGYRLMLCHDSFIHHYLGSSFRKNLDQFYPILFRNRSYFESKWGFSSFAFDEQKSDIYSLLESPTRLLEFNCGIGITLLKLKYLKKKIVVHGVEEEEAKRGIAQSFAPVFSSLETVPDRDYDCILIGNLLEKVEDPVSFLSMLRSFLKEGGVIIGSVHNVTFFRTIEALRQDHFYYENQEMNHFTFLDLEQLFSECGYQDAFFFSWYENFSEEDLKRIELLKPYLPATYGICSYTFRFHKKGTSR